LLFFQIDEQLFAARQLLDAARRFGELVRHTLRVGHDRQHFAALGGDLQAPATDQGLVTRRRDFLDRNLKGDDIVPIEYSHRFGCDFHHTPSERFLPK
jgi:hypothetical protein